MHSNLALRLPVSSYTPGGTLPTHLNWLTDAEVERFWSDVDKQPNDCWYFNGSAGGRSGLFVYRAGNMAAHRVAYRLMTGRVLTNTEFLKPICEDTRCINPGHNQVVPRHLLQSSRAKQHTNNSLEAHPAYQGIMSAQEVVRFLSQPGTLSYSPPTGGSWVMRAGIQYDGETLEDAVRAAKAAA